MGSRIGAVDSMDLVIAVYKEHVDRTLLEENLKRTVEERIQSLEEFERLREELQAGVKAHSRQREPITFL